MKKPKLLIIVLFQNLKDADPYYARSPAPPLPGILLAGMTPPVVEVEVLHEMVRPIDYATDADFIAVSFMDYLAPHAYEVAARFREMGKVVVGGGKFASTFPDEVEPHFDSILVGEAHGVWPQMVEDMVAGKLKRRYVAEEAPPLENIPPPRFDLVESAFSVPVVTEATRGCPHSCTFCQLNIQRLPFRMRPIADVIADLKSAESLPWHKRKLGMILDNNLGGDLRNAKELLREIAKLKFWGFGAQYSIECARDPEFVRLLSDANCRMAFLGMESLNEKSLQGVMKKQNKVAEYKEAFADLHRRGILTFCGVMFGLEEDTPEYYRTLPQKLDEVGVLVILPSISVPIYGTPWYREVVAEGRLVDEDLSHYEGDHLVFKHKHMKTREVYEAYEAVIRAFYAWPKIIVRWFRFISMQRIQESLPYFILKVVLTTIFYFKLSIFQRHHAYHRILRPLPGRKRYRSSEERAAAPPRGGAPPAAAPPPAARAEAAASAAGERGPGARR